MASRKPLPYRWPPRIIFNTDGCLVFKYLKRRNPGDVTDMLVPLADTGVDVVAVLVGINDDLCWRGSPHGELWGETMGDSARSLLSGGTSGQASPAAMNMTPSDLLQVNLAAMVEDGHDVFQLYVDRARQVGLGIYASFRMNDAHRNMEHRMADGRRSALMVNRPDLLIGSPAPPGSAGYAEDFNFSWQWDYAQPEVRSRFLGLFDETLGRYDVDGLELDYCRQPPFFKPNQGFKHVATMTEFMRSARQIVDRHAARRDKDIKLACRVPCSFDASMELGIDPETWIGEGLVDVAAISSPRGWQLEMDVARAVAAARSSGALIYVGSGGTYKASPQDGYEGGQPSLRRAIALNGYRQGASGVHLFNHDYANHRAEPVADGDASDMPLIPSPPIYSGLQSAFDSDRFTRRDLQTLRDLGDPGILAGQDRCYHLSDSSSPGDYLPQLPRKLALSGRGSGPGHSVRLLIEDDIEAGRTEGRIRKTELRLRLTHHEECIERIRCEVNGRQVDLLSAGKISNSLGEEWLVVDDPPLQQGDNTVLVILEGFKLPQGYQQQGPGLSGSWPTLHQCELRVQCQED